MKLHQYQNDALEFCWNHRSAAVFADPGLGKTLITLKLIERFKKHPAFTGAILIAPLRVIYTTWSEEIEKWGLDISYQLVHGPKKLDALRTPADIHALNPEATQWLFEQKFKDNALIIDESSKFKSWKSKRFKTLKKHLDRFRRRVILSGTPAPNSLLDLWSQIFVLDKGERLEPYITHYKRKYFSPVGYNQYQFELKPQADKVIQNRIKPIVKRIDSKEYLDLPDLIENVTKVDLPEDIKKKYDQIEKDLFAQIVDDQIFAPSKAVSYGWCCQIANGGLYKPQDEFEAPLPPNLRTVYDLHHAKTECVLDLVDELQGKPVLIAYKFKHDLERLKDKLSDAEIIGKSPKDDQRLIKRWNEKKIRILIAQCASIAHGLNLQKGGNDIIWYSLTDNLEDYIQFNRRIYRQGIEGQVRVHHILARGTIDEAIMRRLQLKTRTQGALLDALRDYKGQKQQALDQEELLAECYSDALMVLDGPRDDG
jgi:SNF2 family DNA or RNA helicase